MDPATILGIGGQLLGGILGNRSAKKAAAQQRAWALEDQAMQWVRHREASEAGGFNPLATLGLSQGVAPTPASSNNYMGEAIASSALILADNYAKTRQAAMGRQVEDLRRQRDILTRKLTDQTIRPKIAGVYGIGGDNGNAANSSMGASASRGLALDVGSDAVAPNVTNISEIVTTDGGEVRTFRGPDIDEMISGFAINEWGKAQSMARWRDRMGRIETTVLPPYKWQKPGATISESEFRKPFPRKGSEDAFNYHMGRHRPYPAHMWP